jgi:hypothetical protein
VRWWWAWGGLGFRGLVRVCAAAIRSAGVCLGWEFFLGFFFLFNKEFF